MLKGKKILVGVTGSIAAYKAAIFVRLLVKEGAEVKAIMTSAAKEFISPLTLSTLSKNPALSEFTTDNAGEWNNHVELGLWADLMIIAPASANTIGKMANGLCDNLLLATYLSARCPVMFAPAMDLDMYQHPSVLANISKLQGFGNALIEARHGELASGLVGQGRMAEPEELITYLNDFFSENAPLKGKKVMITAGPTYEAIDPVRFIGNYSSGKMGFALAEEAARLGAQVTLITGPTHLSIDNSVINRVNVKSGQQMFEACEQVYPHSDINIFAAAVADYAPTTQADQKIKKADTTLQIELSKTIDIAKTLGARKEEKQFNVGFALETNDELKNAQGKIKSKNFDLIVLNSLQDSGAGFGHDTNKITLIDKANNIQHFELKTKKEVAKDIIKSILEKI
ncbi:MAG: bifunctional phosphopantothenoylcysteine decarboxylase/phosphopantothenate--cysteine ligase CoaBC [Roseivirga sp.]|uniref:bifunctional phosphopantothenoylcysteine decarboxylase/phosphopantothenate--cysteine ligase CoaBC n=1 Tax=Roseivirga sp. TaxID=1964215 RepID=UPI001B26AA05|nr:bifunctional phosphopantothenoylcysteine decarboxylase/phosphopantothenate--cysteine ligase CoaBC [Roseivirga sp.]MBO6659713.1 bifunctional phosphopantothenoylcysteine decarboxylase/phosphopantothenate--cysteine ligase CoaBC [Roseivirga sp.]MBO6759876.1 bifunctional phosphopantothenoylcysteine decarboxylase/phosphopantothenate--cysteine ligase CoaBC [Roseivirga sp.]MBO6907550.1 bifunctional phosphopantothenoylcysteine decarboxylase/phosphopantothenate--cysteine ligase CoaBC [Roseivirga sp.]